MDLIRNANMMDSILQKDHTNKENALYKSIYKFLDYAGKAGYKYTDLHTDKDKKEIALIFGDYNENKEYYRINLSNVTYETIKSRKTVKSSVSIEKLIDYNETDERYNKAQVLSKESTVEIVPRKYANLLINIYNSNRDENLPKIRNYDLSKALLYSFAAAYGATAISAVDNTSLVNNTYYGLLHLGMLVAPYIPLQFIKKTRSIPQMLSLALVSWVANSISYYPVGMLMGHTADNLTDMINWYKFQIGLGSGSYIDHYGPLAIKIDSHAKALSYAGRIGLAGVLSKFDGIAKKLKAKRRVNYGKK
jgi:hypothetical protein